MHHGWVSLALCAGMLFGLTGCHSARRSAAMNAGPSPAVALQHNGPSPIRRIRQVGGSAEETRPVELGRYEDAAHAGGNWSRLLERFGNRQKPVSLPRTDVETDDVFAEEVVHETRVSDDF